jgi:PKD repeat protein
VDWDFGDGQSQIVTGPPLVSHTYTQVGTYLISPHATVTIPDGSLRIATTSQALKIP